MKRFAAALLLCLSACASGPTGVPERDLQWRTSLRGNEVRAVVFDRTGSYRIERVSLAGPNGQVLPAREMTRENQSGSGFGPAFGVGGTFGSRGGAGGGLGVSVPLDTDVVSPLERRTSAIIPLPDPDLYRRTADQWRLEVDMITPAGVAYHTTMPAPTP